MTSRGLLMLEEVLAAFDEHLHRTRGLCPGIRRNYARFAQAFPQAGTDLAVIDLWLGHSSPAVTHQYLAPQKQYYNGWPTPTPHRHDSTPATGSSPSCTTSDYAQLRRPPANRKPQPALPSTHPHTAELHITTS